MPNNFEAWVPLVEGSLLKLGRLFLKNLRLLNTAVNIVSILDLSALHTLDIRSCDNVVPVLRAFVKGFQQTSNVSLRTFRFYNRHLTKDVRQAAEQLLGSVEGLNEVVVTFGKGDLLLQLSHLLRHAESLQDLEITTRGKVYSVADLRLLSVEFRDLQTLALSIGDPDVYMHALGELEPFDISIVHGYTDALVG